MPVLPPSTPRVVPWGPASVLAALLLWVASQMVAPTVYRALSGQPPQVKAAANDPASRVAVAATPGEMMTYSAISNLLTLLAVPLVLAATSGATRADFGVGLRGLGRQVGRGLIAYPLLAPIVFGTMLICILVWKDPTPHPLQNALRLDRSARMATILVLAGVVLAPAAEELIFRGVLLGWLTRVALGIGGAGKASTFDPGLLAEPESSATRAELIDQDPDAEVTVLGPDGPGFDPHAAPRGAIDPMPWPEFDAAEGAPKPVARGRQLLGANLIVSLIFATLHGAVWPTPIPIFFLSLGLGLLYQRTGSILGPIALHMLFNGVSTLMMFLGVGLNDPPPKAPELLPPPAIAVPLLGTIRYDGEVVANPGDFR